MVHEKMTPVRAVQVDDELDSDRRPRSRVRQHDVAEGSRIGVDADDVMGFRPVDRADVEAEIEICLVAGDLQALEPARGRQRVIARPVIVPDGTSAPIVATPVDDDRRIRATGPHRDDAVVLLGVEWVEPEPIAFGWMLEVDHRPVLLEPFVDEREESRPRGARGVDVARQPRVDLGLLLLGVATVVPALWLQVRDTP